MPPKQTSQAIYIGLDLGNDCGFAVMNLAGKLLESGTWRHKPLDTELPAARWIKFATNVRTLVNRYKVGNTLIVSYENVPARIQKGPRAAYVYGGWLAMLEIAEAEHRDIRWQPIEIGDWKEALTGRRGAKKPVYIAAVNKRYKKSLQNRKGMEGEDEAAAIGVVYASVVLRDKLVQLQR